jgi:cation diffusion facilitator CzcD-associated flavoprotein CzcO
MLVNDRQPDPETFEKAKEEDVVILGTSMTAFDLIAKLSEMGLSGS